MRRLFLLPIVAFSAAGALFASSEPPRTTHFVSKGGRLVVFPADSLDLSVMTFTIDGDTVSREEFFKLDRNQIRTLEVTPAPANLIEVETHAAAMQPLQPDSLPGEIDYVVDGVVVDRAAYSSIPPSAIASITVFKGVRPRMIIPTTKGIKRNLKE